jgi:hypothetical protein
MSFFDFFRSKPPAPQPHAPPPITTEEEKRRRIAALLSGQGAYLAMELCGVDHVPTEFMRMTFPFTRREILDHLAEHSIPIESFLEAHWMQLSESGGKWIVTEIDERTGPWDREFVDLKAAREFLRDYCLSHTYTGLDFSA